MGTRIADLQCKEVVNICDGARMGYVNDVELDIHTGRLVAIVVPGPWSFSCLFSKGEEFVVPWCQIEKDRRRYHTRALRHAAAAAPQEKGTPPQVFYLTA